MKKTILLLFAAAAVSTSFAQSNRYPADRNQTRDVILGNDHAAVYNKDIYNKEDRNAPADYRKKAEEIKRVTKDYDRRIDLVQRDRRLEAKEKARETSRLQKEKEQAVRDINARYAKPDVSRNNRYNAHN